MINKGTVLLETDRLILRKFKYSDAEYMFKNWGSDPKVSKFLSWSTHSDVNVSQKIINNWIEEYNNNIYNWAIELKSIHEAIGAISIVELDQASEACEIGYCISSRYWNEGFTSEAFKAVINYLFKEVHINRIAAKHDIDNPASGRVMKKCGLTYEGTLRESKKIKGKLGSFAVYSILKSEWIASQKNLY